MSNIEDCIQFIIKSILPLDAEVTINTHDNNGTTIIEINAPTQYIGQLIGRDGKIIKSIRTLLNLAFPETRYLLEIKE